MAFLNNSTGQLFSNLLQELRTLFSKEIELAKIEMSEKVSVSIRNSITIAIGAAVGYAGVLVLLAAAVYGLGTVIPMWLSALIIGAVVTTIGAIAALTAMNKLKKLKLEPEHTIANIREDRKWLKRQLEEVTS
ncbi:MAG: phage holin family protein [Desulfobacteraceae bacterium]|nr:MAG: phage holin family protein [Desulfobacteraceae bacterium]